MKSDLPKVLHEVAGKPMVHWVVDACRQAGCEKIVVVVGYRGELVRESLADQPDVSFVEQAEQLGTGHAALMAEPELGDFPGDVFVLNGDGPLLRADTLTTLLQTHRDAQAHGTVATAVLDDPTGYGRVLRDDAGHLLEIVEQKDATPDQLVVQEVNPNYLCYRASVLFDALKQVGTDNAQGEVYLTDVPKVLRAAGHTVAVVDAVPAEDAMGINDQDQLAQVDRILRDRLANPESK